MKKFFNGLIVTILLAVIVGGLGYIGYTYYSMNYTGMTMPPATSGTPGTSPEQSQQDKDSMGMGQMQMPESAGPQNPNEVLALETTKRALANKDDLERAITNIKQAMDNMVMDPYMPSSAAAAQKNDMGGMSGMDASGSAQTPQPPAATPPPQAQQNAQANGGNTTINIYPEQNNQPAMTAPMPSAPASTMNPAYDPGKMEKIHTGIYKMALALELLDQLNSDLLDQAENASVGSQNLAQYYAGQFNISTQNHNKLKEALAYIKDAAPTLNTTPLISESELSKERVKQIHEGIFKMAQGVAGLSRVDEDFMKQAIALSNAAQQAYYTAAMTGQTDMSSMNGTQTNMFGSLFGNLNFSTIVNVVLIVFVVAFILGLFGFIFSLLKSPPRKEENPTKSN